MVVEYTRSFKLWLGLGLENAGFIALLYSANSGIVMSRRSGSHRAGALLPVTHGPLVCLCPDDIRGVPIMGRGLSDSRQYIVSLRAGVMGSGHTNDNVEACQQFWSKG